jgi:hypothetical protein
MKNEKRIEKLYELFDALLEKGEFDTAHQVLGMVDTLRYQDEYITPSVCHEEE